MAKQPSLGWKTLGCCRLLLLQALSFLITVFLVYAQFAGARAWRGGWQGRNVVLGPFWSLLLCMWMAHPGQADMRPSQDQGLEECNMGRSPVADGHTMSNAPDLF